ncbi:MAG: plastocyanin/azurin family copper-binding protein, partial [bacterium]
VERDGMTAQATTTITVAAPPPPPPPGGDAIVTMKDNFFSPRNITVKPGDKITWNNLGAKPHTATDDNGGWDSGTVNAGGSWSWSVPASTQDGTNIPYYCVFHGDKGGIGMSGVIQVSTGPPQPSLSVALSADPAAGDAPLQGVDMIAQVSGTTSGDITYKFDCTNDGTFEHTFTTASDFYTAIDVWTYNDPGTYTAKVVVERDGMTAQATTTITVAAPPPPPPPGGDIIVQMKDNFFSPKNVTAQPGTKIIWQNVGRKDHTSTSDTGVFDSGNVAQGRSYSWTVPSNAQTGTNFPYFCVYHGDKGGQGMAGTIAVGDGSGTPPPPVPPPGGSGDTTIVTTPGNTFSPEEVEIRPGDTVVWKFSGATHNVTFKKSDQAPQGGNIPDSPPGTEAARTFENEDNYDYECTLHKDQEGRVRVKQ